MEAMERRVCVLQEAEVQRQKERLLDQEEMDKNRQELQKAQSLQVRIYQSMTLCSHTQFGSFLRSCVMLVLLSSLSRLFNIYVLHFRVNWCWNRRDVKNWS
jgi:hypothetical protein